MEVSVGLIGLGNVGTGTLQILTENARSIGEKLGFGLTVKAVCSRSIYTKKTLQCPGGILRTENWRDVVNNPEIDIVVEVIGGTATARHIIEESLKQRKSVVTANKELMALCGPELWSLANAN